MERGDGHVLVPATKHLKSGAFKMEMRRNLTEYPMRSNRGACARMSPASVAEKSRMTIGHCIHGLDLGGAQQIIKLLVRGAPQRGFRHFVYSPTSGVFADEIIDAGAMVRIVPRWLPKFDPLWIANLARAMRNDGIDVVHTHLFGDSLHGFLASRIAGHMPVVMTLHIGVEGQTRAQYLGYRWLLARGVRSIACTASVGRSWARASANIEVIANAIDAGPPSLPGNEVSAEVRRQIGVGKEACVIGAVGRLVAQKSFADLVTAFARVRHASSNDCRLVFVGEGPLHDELRQQAQREQVEPWVHFLGFRPNVRELLTAFDVVAFSSEFEGLPIALLEAMAAARCVVATDAPGILDAVTHEREALIVPVHAPDCLSDSLHRAIHDPSLRHTLGQAARRRVVREFSVDHMVESYDRVYREIRLGADGRLDQETRGAESDH